MRATDAIPSLTQTLDHIVSNLRKEAALALGEIGDPAPLPELERAAEDSDPEVRKAARLAIAQIGQRQR